MKYYGNVRKNLERLKIRFNEEAVVVLTSLKVPIQLKVVASLGKTFNYCGPLTNPTAIDLFVCMNKIIMECDRHEDWFNINHEFAALRKQIIDEKLSEEKPTDAQRYLLLLMNQAADFLRMNPGIIVVPADKGGKIVIMEKSSYMKKMHDYLDDNVAAKNYELIPDSLQTIRTKIELVYAEIIFHINPFLLMDGTLSTPLTIEPFSIPLLYGCPKIHKEGVPIRPIVSSVNMIGNFLSGWLLKKLQLVAKIFNKYNIENSAALISELNNFKTEPGHKLCSFDYVSMFTNIDVDETFAIILEHYHVISATTSVPADVFIECLKLFTNHATFFLFDGYIFKQIKGLAMGNRLAQVLAEIRTNFALHTALTKFDAESISFLNKYVDDILTSIKEDKIESVMSEMAKSVNMELTTTKEDVNRDVEFLDCIIRRNLDSSISSRWFKKDYASLSILNYHSYHPVNMKNNVVFEMIKHAYAITSPEFIEHTKEILIGILKRSSYPEHFILENVSVKPFAPVEPPKVKFSDPKTRYVSCPYVNPLFKSIKSIVKKNQLKVKLAPKPSSNNKRMLLSRIKDVRDRSSIQNAVFKVRCLDCDFTHVTTTKNFDVQRTLQRLIITKNSPCDRHTTEYPHHSINQDVTVIKTFYNKFDTEHSSYVISHINALMENKKNNSFVVVCEEN